MHRIMSMAIAGAALVLAGVVPSAWAANGQWYVRADGAFSSLGDNGWTSSSGPVTTSSKNGWGADLAFGYDLGRVWAGGAIRGEFALTWKFNPVDGISSGGASLAQANGHTRMLGLTYNLVDDFLPSKTFDPYLGVGAGYARLNFYQWGGPAGVNSTAGAFAYQVLAGVKVRLSPSARLDVGYSWFTTSNTSVQTHGGQKTNMSYRANSIAIGVDWMF